MDKKAFRQIVGSILMIVVSPFAAIDVLLTGIGVFIGSKICHAFANSIWPKVCMLRVFYMWYYVPSWIADDLEGFQESMKPILEA